MGFSVSRLTIPPCEKHKECPNAILMYLQMSRFYELLCSKSLKLILLITIST